MDGSLDFSVSGDTFPGGRTLAKAPKLKEGEECEARFGGESEWFPGTVKAPMPTVRMTLTTRTAQRNEGDCRVCSVKQAPKTPQIKRQDTEDSLKSTQKLKRAASEVEDKERADASRRQAQLPPPRGARLVATLEAAEARARPPKSCKSGRRRRSANSEKQARREQEQAPAAIKEAAKRSTATSFLLRWRTWAAVRRNTRRPRRTRTPGWHLEIAYPDKVEARTWSGLEAKATPELQSCFTLDTSDIPTGNSPEVALLAERSLRRSRGPGRHLEAAARLLAASVDFSVPKEKLGPKFATISAHDLSKPIDRSTDVYGRTVKTS